MNPLQWEHRWERSIGWHCVYCCFDPQWLSVPLVLVIFGFPEKSILVRQPHPRMRQSGTDGPAVVLVDKVVSFAVHLKQNSNKLKDEEALQLLQRASFTFMRDHLRRSSTAMRLFFLNIPSSSSILSTPQLNPSTPKCPAPQSVQPASSGRRPV